MKVIIKVVGYGWNWVETDFVGLIFSRSHYNYLSVQSFEDSLDISSLGSTTVQWRFTDCNYINYNLALRQKDLEFSTNNQAKLIC